MSIKGMIKVDHKTKKLVKRLKQGDIAVISHEDLDEIAAKSLISKKVKAIVNAKRSMTGRYPNIGPYLLINSGVTIVDNAGDSVMKLKEGSRIQIDEDGNFYCGQNLIAQGRILTKEQVEHFLEKGKDNIENLLNKFIDNTLDYAKKEKFLIMGGVKIPETQTCFKDKHVLIVVRGNNYKEDLAAVKVYIDEMKPILVGVDGGADALLEYGYQPDIIIGDMDSVSDKSLLSCREIIVHAYPDGRAPGLERINKMGLESKIFTAPGTSEDIAMLLAYEKGASLIVAVGTHSNMIDFLEKGRKGMASTFLVRLKVGSILVDAKGASKLYNQKLNLFHIASLFAAALIPIFIIFRSSPPIQYIIKLLELQMKLVLGF
jgi:uncharacterized membrane-anchored protein